MRTPRNFDGTSVTGKMIDELLRDALVDIGKRAKSQGHEILASWGEILGAKFADLTKADAFRDGVLTVKVKSSTLYSLLCQHEKPRLLARLREMFPRAAIRDIVFRIG